MAGNEESFKFDLDTKDAISKINEMHSKIGDLGSAESLKGLISGFVSLSAPIFAAGAAVFTFKEAFDLAMEGEKIGILKNSFKLLTETAGVSGETILSGMEQAANGTMATTELIKLANDAVVKLGANSEKIPQIFELSRKAAKALGKETEDVFSAVNLAAATGSQRAIAQLGLKVNLQKAEEKYAESIGVSVKALTDQEKQTARLNAIIENGESKFKGISLEQNNMTEASKRMHVAWQEGGDAVAVAFNKIFGPSFTKALEYFSKLLESSANHLKDYFGDGAEKAAAHVKNLSESLVDANKRLEELKSGYGQSEFSDISTDIKSQEQYIKNLENMIEKENHMKTLKSVAQVGHDEENKPKTEAQLNADMIAEIERNKFTTIGKLSEHDKQIAEQHYKDKVKYARSASEGITAAFKQGAFEAQKNLNDFGKIGQLVFTTLNKNAASAFRALGDGSKSAADAMKGFLLGSLADISEAQGEQLLAYGIGTFNPIPIAEGGALIALSGLLRSQAGASGSSGLSSGGSSGGGSIASAPSNLSSPEIPTAAAVQGKSVVIQVQGHYFETEQTKTRLVDMIRDVTDATDFKYQQIGVN